MVGPVNEPLRDVGVYVYGWPGAALFPSHSRGSCLSSSDEFCHDIYQTPLTKGQSDSGYR